MPRTLFGGTGADWTADVISGIPFIRPGRTVTVHLPDGTQVTDLLINGEPATDLTSDDLGYLPVFYGPDETNDLRWKGADGKLRRFAPPGPPGPAGPGGTDAGVAAYVADAMSATRAELDGLFAPVTGSSEYAQRLNGNQGLARFFNVLDFGAVGDGVTDDTQALLDAIAACKASVGGIVWVPAGTYLISSTLVIDFNFCSILGPGPSAKIKYTGSNWAIDVNSAGTQYIYNVRVGGFELQGTSAAAGGVLVPACQQADFSIERFIGFTAVGSWAMRFTTQGTGGRAGVHNRIWGGHVNGCYNGIQFTKDPADLDTDGANHNRVFGTRVTSIGADVADEPGNPTAIGFDVDFGENTQFYGIDATTNTDNTIGLRINDDVVGVFGCRTDGSQGVNALDSYGIYIGPNGRDHLILNPTGNGMHADKYVYYEDPAITGYTFRHGRNVWIGNVKRGLAATGADFWDSKPWLNGGISTIQAGELGTIRSTWTEGEVRRANAAQAGGIEVRPLVAVESVAPSTPGGFAMPGSTVTVLCDAGAISPGDTLVQSGTDNARAKADNTQTNPRYIIGFARSAKAGGALGSVRAYID